MKTSAVYLSILFFFCLTSVFSQSLAEQHPAGDTIIMIAPTTVSSGSEFVIEIKITTGADISYSRFQQTLPYGFTAKDMTTDIKGYEFEFKNQNVKYIWFKPPKMDNFTLKYLVNTDKSVKGQYYLEGEFKYVVNGEKLSLKVKQVIVEVKDATEKK